MSNTSLQNIIAGLTSISVRVFISRTGYFIFGSAIFCRITGLSDPPRLTTETRITVRIKHIAVRHLTMSYTFFEFYTRGYTSRTVGVFICRTLGLKFGTASTWNLTSLPAPSFVTDRTCIRGATICLTIRHRCMGNALFQYVFATLAGGSVCVLVKIADKLVSCSASSRLRTGFSGPSCFTNRASIRCRTICFTIRHTAVSNTLFQIIITRLTGLTIGIFITCTFCFITNSAIERCSASFTAPTKFTFIAGIRILVKDFTIRHFTVWNTLLQFFAARLTSLAGSVFVVGTSLFIIVTATFRLGTSITAPATHTNITCIGIRTR